MLTCSKVYLSLAVTARRPDGYHDLDSLFYPFRDPSDEITLEDAPEANGVSIRCDAPGVPLEPEKNLCGKAVFAYCKAAGIPLPGLVIHLKKNIPVAAGMGGGSADGATVLRLLQEKYGALTEAQLEAAAFSLGADVPFFLTPRPSYVTGAGDEAPSPPRGLATLWSSQQSPLAPPLHPVAPGHTLHPLLQVSPLAHSTLTPVLKPMATAHCHDGRPLPGCAGLMEQGILLLVFLWGICLNS